MCARERACVVCVCEERVCSYVCVCVCVRARVRGVCVCVCERACVSLCGVCVCVSERASVFVSVRVCVCERARAACVRVCVCARACVRLVCVCVCCVCACARARARARARAARARARVLCLCVCVCVRARACVRWCCVFVVSFGVLRAKLPLVCISSSSSDGSEGLIIVGRFGGLLLHTDTRPSTTRRSLLADETSSSADTVKIRQKLEID